MVIEARSGLYDPGQGMIYLLDMKRRGVALPFAMFFTGLIFCLCTVMATEALTNLRLTSMEAEQTRQAAAARGAIALTVYRMNADPGWAEAHLYDPAVDNPNIRQRDVEDGMVIYTWTSKRSAQPHIYHVHARVETAGLASVFQEANGTVRKGDDVGGLAYAQTPAYSNGPDAIDTGFILRTDAQQWEPAPLATAYYYEGGVLHTSDQPPRNMPAGCMDPLGNTYVVLHPLWDALVANPLTHPMMVRIIDQGTERASVWQLYSLLHSVSEMGVPLTGPQPAVVRVNEAGASTALPPIPGYRLENGQPVPTSGLTGLTWQPSCDGHTLFITNLRAGGDILYRCEDVDTDHPTWSAIGPPPRTELTDPYLRPCTGEGYAPYLGSVTQDRYGTVYALWGEWREGSTPISGIFRLEGDQWRPVPPPPEIYYNAQGQLQRDLTRKADSFCSMRSGPGGELFGLWFPSGRSQLLKYSGGVWNAVRPPRESMANVLDVDGDGKLLVKYPLPGQPDELYRIVDGEAKLLPRVPGDYRQVVTGNVIERPGVYAQTIMTFAGGGHKRSDDPHYYSVATY